MRAGEDPQVDHDINIERTCVRRRDRRSDTSALVGQSRGRTGHRAMLPPRAAVADSPERVIGAARIKLLLFKNRWLRFPEHVRGPDVPI